MRINLLIIATNRYTEFLKDLLPSIEKYFCKDVDVNINIFTDHDHEKMALESPIEAGINYFHVDHLPWPGSTLYRFHHFKRYKEQLRPANYFFYIDADTIIKAPITSNEILGMRVGTLHCGFVNKRGSYEGRPTSTSYVGPNEGEHYFGGGFWGFSSEEFWKFVDKAIEMISTDADNGIRPEHNDESVLNRYLIDNKPTRILTPSFHYPVHAKNRKSWRENYPCKILLVEKDHKEFQV